MEKNKNYQQQKETETLYRSKRQQETQQKLKQIFNKTEKIINQLANYSEKQIRQSSVSEHDNPQLVSSFYTYKKQLSCVRVVNLTLPSAAKPKSNIPKNIGVQTQYVSNKLMEKQETRSSTTHCLTQNSENKKSFNDLSSHTRSLMLFGQSSQKSFFPPSTVVVKQICLNCNKNNSSSYKSVSKSRGKGISITSCSPSRKFNGGSIELKCQQRLKNKYLKHSRNISNISGSTPKISLFKNIFNTPSMKRTLL